MAAGGESGDSPGTGSRSSLGRMVRAVRGESLGTALSAFPEFFLWRLSVKPESWDQRLKKLITGSWPGRETVPATKDATDGCDGAGP